MMKTRLLLLCCFLGTAGSGFAQTNVSVSSQVKDDIEQRLKSAKDWMVPKSVIDGPLRTRCNGGGGNEGNTISPADACEQAANFMARKQLGSLNDYMIGFKACAMDRTFEGCRPLLGAFVQFGRLDYAVAMFELGLIKDASETSAFEFGDPDSLSFNIQPSGGSARIILRDRSDIVETLRTTCFLHMAALPNFRKETREMGQYGLSPAEQEKAVAEEEHLTATLCRNLESRSGIPQSEWVSQYRVDQQHRFQAADAQQYAEQSYVEEARAKDARSRVRTGAILGAMSQANDTMQAANTQQQANMQAMADTMQQQRYQQQQRQEQQRQDTISTRRSVDLPPASTRQIASIDAPVATPTGTSSRQSSASPKPSPTCTVMNSYVNGTTRVESDGWVTGHLTNTSSQPLYVSWAFKKNGVPDGPDAGGGVINPGQTVGGEGGGIWSTNADKNPPEIYWYAVLKSDEDAGKPCSHHRW